MHTDARSAKKDVISTKPRKAMDVVRIHPRAQKSTTEPPSHRLPLPYVAVFGACYLV